MTSKYTVEGMTCQGCVATVQERLENYSSISSAKVSLEEKSVEILATEVVSLSELQRILGDDAKYRIKKYSASRDNLELGKGWFAIYKPLLLIFLFIAGVSALSVHEHGSIDMMKWMRYFMAGFFIVFSFFKFLDLKSFAESYAMYDLLAMKVNFYGYIYPFLELLLGLAYLTGYEPRLTYIATIVLMAFSSLGVIQSVVNKKKIRCACLGAVFNLPMSTVTIIEDLLMVAMACYMLWAL